MAVFVPRFLRQLRDVLIGTPADNDVLTYDSADGMWKPAAGGGGGSLTPPVTLTGTDPAQAVLTLEADPAQTEHIFRVYDDAGDLAVDIDAVGKLDVRHLAVQEPPDTGGGAGTSSSLVSPSTWIINSGTDATAEPLQVWRWNGATSFGRVFAIGRTGAIIRVTTLTPSSNETGLEMIASQDTTGNAIELWDFPFNNMLFALTYTGGILATLPTADPGGGELWNDNGVVTIGPSAGGGAAGPAGGVLSGTYPNPGFAADMATQAELDAHVNDATDAHDATAVSFAPAGTIAATTVQAAIEEVASEAAGGGAPTTADYLVGTAQGGLSAEIVVGSSPGGELGGTWASPTVDATHSGSTHAAVQAAAEATAASALTTHEADTTSVHGITDTSALALTANVVTKALYDANTVLAANSDDTPAALTMGASTILARLAAGNIKAASVAEILTLLAAYSVGGTDVAVADGGTGSSTAGGALTNLGVSAFIQTVLDDADAATARTTLGVAGQTVRIPIPLDTPDATGNGYPALSTAATPGGGFSNVRRVVPAFTHAVDGTWEGTIRIPANYSSTGKVILSFVANATTGAVRSRVSTAVVASGVTEDTAYTDETYVNTTVPGTARQRFDVSFTLTTTPVANSTLNVKATRQGTNGGDTLTVHALLWEAVFEYVAT